MFYFPFLLLPVHIMISYDILICIMFNGMFNDELMNINTIYI